MIYQWMMDHYHAIDVTVQAIALGGPAAAMIAIALAAGFIRGKL